jgi:hypothetical protein
MKIKLNLLLSTVLVLLSACGGETSVAKPEVTPTPTPAPTAIKQVVISQPSLMPTVPGVAQSFELMISNYTDEGVNLSSATALAHTYLPSSNISGQKNSLYDMSACTKELAPQHSCIIKITPQGDNGRFVLDSNFIGAKSNTSYQATQLIQYGDIAATNGFKVSSTSLDVVKLPTQTFNLSIPFVLDKDYANVEVVSKVNPAVPIVVSCMSNQFYKGNSCTAHLAFKGGTFSNQVQLVGTPAMVQQKSGKFILKSLSSTTDVAQVKMNSLSNIVGNLINNGFNTVLKPNEKSTISIMNTGLAGVLINNISTPSGAGISISADSCSNSTLQSNLTCNFTLQNSSKVNTTSVISIPNNLGTSTFNVIQLASGNLPALTMSANQDLTYTVVNQSEEVKLVVKNQSTTPTTLSSLAFSGLGAGFSFAANSDSNACDTQGLSTNLQQNESCTLLIKYSPSVVIAKNTLNFMVTGSYIESDNSTRTYATNTAIDYSAISAKALLNVSSSILDLAIRAANNESVESTIVVTNNGGTSAQNLTVESNQFIPYNLQLTADSCSGTNLAPNSSCVLRVKFGPRTANLNQTDAFIRINYLPSAKSNEGLSQTYVHINTVAKTAAFITATSAALDASTGIVAASSNATGYSFYPTIGQYLALKYVYSNSGTAAATSFNLALDTLQPGIEIDNNLSTCPVGANATTLAAGGSCTLVVKLLNSDFLGAFGANHSYLLSAPGYSYSDNTGVNLGASSTTSATMVAQPWLNPTAVAQTTANVGGLQALTVHFSATGLAPAVISGNAGITFTLTDANQAGFSFPSGSSCTTALGAALACDVTITYPDYIPAASYNLAWTASTTDSNAPASKLPLTGVVMVTPTPILN